MHTRPDGGRETVAFVPPHRETEHTQEAITSDGLATRALHRVAPAADGCTDRTAAAS